MTRNRWTATILVGSLAIAAVGCTPRIRVTPNPGPEAGGIRYYRPKPYLKIVPAEIQFAKDASRVEPGLVTISLEYLPDFTEEYAIDVRSGFGVADVSLTLEDGWNLTQISQELDSQTDENVSAAGDLIKAVSGLVPTAAGQTDPPVIEFTVPASDVPLGFYESVIGRGPDGRKRLYGFRYLGFLPYQSCPTLMGGIEGACCGDPEVPLYGLTFEAGRMVFKPLPVMAAPPRQTVTTFAAGETVHVAPLGHDRQAQAAQIEIDLRAELQRSYPAVAGVQAEWDHRDGATTLRVRVRVRGVDDAAPLEAVREAARETLAAWLPEQRVDVEMEVE